MRTIIRNNYDPHIGDYHERIIQDEAREKTWLFDCDGVYLDITAGRGDTKVVNELGDSEVDATSQKLVTDELGKKQDTLVAGDNITIEGNVISAGGGNYTAGYGLTLNDAEFAADTSVLATKTDLAGKQDTLTTSQLAAANSGITSTGVTKLSGLANIKSIGSNLSLNSSTGELSATDTTYTAGTGLSLNGTEFSVDTSTVQSKLTAGSNITIAGDTISATDTTYSDFVGATSGAAGAHGLVPAPALGDTDKYLKSDGSWATVSSYTLPAASANTLGGVKIGSNLSMDANDVLSATDTTYSNFVGTDGTATGTAGLVPAPATTDAGKVLSASGAWTGLPDGIKTLTTDDYNYPTSGTPDRVALNLLPTGIYQWDSSVDVRNAGSEPTAYKPKGSAIVMRGADNEVRIISPSSESNSLIITVARTNQAQAVSRFYTQALDSLTYTYDNERALSAKAGATLNTNIGDLSTLTTTAKTSAVAAINELDSGLGKVEPLSGSGAPTTSTAGVVGQDYVDTATGDKYYLSAIVEESGQPDSYTWVKYATGSGGPTVVQTTGTSTTDVMSQNAVTNALASKEDVGTTETLTIATSDWAALASSDPYDYSATVTAATTIGANSLVELINDQAVLFATHGFAIGAISGQSVTIYSIGQPTASVSLKINVKG